MLAEQVGFRTLQVEGVVSGKEQAKQHEICQGVEAENVGGRNKKHTNLALEEQKWARLPSREHNV